MKQKEEIKLQEIKEYLDKNPQIKTVVYIGLGIVGLYVAGKVFSALATSVRGFNELRSAINGK
ncbi:MAG: hypothetical protein RI922_551 [Bacteroidota bacterium]|jgi:hypothetical protein